jgi:hypothetical protein
MPLQWLTTTTLRCSGLTAWRLVPHIDNKVTAWELLLWLDYTLGMERHPAAPLLVPAANIRKGWDKSSKETYQSW